MASVFPRPALLAGVAGLGRTYDGCLGVTVLDTAGITIVSPRGEDRFAVSSTHKTWAASFVLARFGHRQEGLSRRVIWPSVRPSMIVTAQSIEALASVGERDAALAEVGRLASPLEAFLSLADRSGLEWL